MTGRATRDPWISLGMTVTAIAAAASSFSGLHALARATGWETWMAPLFPLCLDAYAATATRVWLSASTRSPKARSFAKWNAIIAILLSLAGNGVHHLLAANLLEMSWVVVVAVGAAPPVILGLVSHLATVRKEADHSVLEDDGSVAEDVPLTPLPAKDRPPILTLDELLQAARIADDEYRRRYGRGITRDALRSALHVGGQRATEVLRRLRTENDEADASAANVTRTAKVGSSGPT